MGALPSVVAIHGLRRAGKGTIAAHLVRTRGYEIVKLSETLKAMLSTYLSRSGFGACLIERCIEGDLKEVPLGVLGGKSARFAMQSIGTEFRDSLHKRMWLEIAFGRIGRAVAAGRRTATDDLRLPFESERFASIGAHRIMVETSRVSASSAPGAVPASDPEPSAGPDYGSAMLSAMVSVLSGHCGFVGPWTEHAAHPVPELGGHSLSDAARSLDLVWRPLMEASVDLPDYVASHESERGLPRSDFDVVFRNDGSIVDLESMVDGHFAGL